MNFKNEKENTRKSEKKKENTESDHKAQRTDKLEISGNPEKTQKSQNPENSEKAQKPEKPERSAKPKKSEKSENTKKSNEQKSTENNNKNEKKLVRQKSSVKVVNKDLKGVNTSREKNDESSKENALMTQWSKSRRHSSFGENRGRRDRKASVDLWLMVKDAQLLQEKARRKKIEDEEKAKATKKLKKNLTYEDWVKSKSADRRASATPIYNFDRRVSTASTAVDVKPARRESLPIIQAGRRGSLVSKHNPNRRLSHQEWDELKEEKMLAQAEKEAQELEKKIAEKRAALSQRRTSLKPGIATVQEN